jgi:hypothetical protein
MAEIRVGDVGTIIEIDMQEDVSAAVPHSDTDVDSDLALEVRLPDATVVIWGPLVLEGTNFFRYTVVDGDFAQKGTYRAVPKFGLGTWEGRGDPVTWYVKDQFEL